MKDVRVTRIVIMVTLLTLSSIGCWKATKEANELLPIAKRSGQEMIDEFRSAKREYDNIKLRHQCHGCGGLKNLPCLFCGAQGNKIQVVIGSFGPQQIPVLCGQCNGSMRIVCGVCG